jgi:hypothetical protein
MKLFEVARNTRQTLSWKLGYGRGKAGRYYRCPWWADRLVFAVAYMQGRTAAGQPRQRGMNRPHAGSYPHHVTSETLQTLILA